MSQEMSKPDQAGGSRTPVDFAPMKPPKKPETHSFYARALQRVIEHVATHLDQALDLETLAAKACLSPFHFHRVFRGMVGETPVELIRRLRMERAAWRLIHTERSVTAIAFDTGYETHEAFTRAFRTCFGTSPSGFRARNHPRTELAATAACTLATTDACRCSFPEIQEDEQ